MLSMAGDLLAPVGHYDNKLTLRGMGKVQIA